MHAFLCPSNFIDLALVIGMHLDLNLIQFAMDFNSNMFCIYCLLVILQIRLGFLGVFFGGGIYEIIRKLLQLQWAINIFAILAAIKFIKKVTR